ncbi:MAG: HU family DNA-binding protein [Acidimicrobiales bacterium]
MNRAELIEEVAQRSQVSAKDADAVVRSALEVMAAALGKGDKVNITGYLNAETGVRAARKARNPRTGEVVKVPRTKTVKLRPGAKFKELATGKVKLAKLAKANGTAPAKKAAPPARKASPAKTASSTTSARTAKTTTSAKAAAKKAHRAG